MSLPKVFPIHTETACVLKWAWSTVFLRQGTSSSCHRTDQHAIPVDNFASFHNLPNKVQAREMMLAGQWPQGGCQYCEKIESAGGMSDRQYQVHHGNDQYLTPAELLNDPAQTHVVPTLLEIYFNNTCNMSCLYCGSHFSSKWEEENRRFGEFNSGVVKFGWDKKQPDLDYHHMLSEFWRYLHEEDRYLKLRQYQIAGGEPFFQEELEQTIEFWDSHPNPNLCFNFITNLKVSPRRFQAVIERLGRMVEQGKIQRVQISASLDSWGPQQEYVRWGLDLAEWTENFEYLLDKPWVQQCINSAINALSIHTMPELANKLNQWNNRRTSGYIVWSFMTVTNPFWMVPDIFGPGIFEQSFTEVLAAMPSKTANDISVREHMAGIAKQVCNSQRNHDMINGLKCYLDEIDRRRGTNWRPLFPWLDQDWK